MCQSARSATRILCWTQRAAESLSQLCCSEREMGRRVMKRIYVNEKWCLGCHLCEYYCAFANSGEDDAVKAPRDVVIPPRIASSSAET